MVILDQTHLEFDKLCPKIVPDMTGCIPPQILSKLPYGDVNVTCLDHWMFGMAFVTMLKQCSMLDDVHT